MRLTNWETRLHAVLDSAATRPFCWGEHDCALFACAAIEALTGRDVALPLRGQYRDALTAAIAVRDFLVANGRPPAVREGDPLRLEALAEFIAEQEGFDEIPPLFAQRGDVVVFDTPQGVALYVVAGDGWRCVAPTPEGLAAVPLDRIRRAWRIA